MCAVWQTTMESTMSDPDSINAAPCHTGDDEVAALS